MSPDAAPEVTRLEHENLYAQVMENVRSLRRLEAELRVLRVILEHRQFDEVEDAS